jgi:hypothetical protein
MHDPTEAFGGVDWATDDHAVCVVDGQGPVVDALLEAGLEVVVVSSRSVKALRERYGTAGNKPDRSDAYVLADCLRTDGHRWRNLEPDSPATVTLRSHVRARKDLVETGSPPPTSSTPTCGSCSPAP